MPGYLDQYGAGEDRRNRIIVKTAAAVLIVGFVTSFGWYILKNHHQEGVVKNFIADVKRGELAAAYRDWGCATPQACTGYTMDQFASDWGSKAQAPPDPAVFGLIDSESCNNGVLLTVAVNAGRTDKLWVEKGRDAISFSPYPICPHKSPYAIMLHRTLGLLRKPLLK